MPILTPTKDAVLAAHALLLIESARLYGLVQGGPEIFVNRCEEIIAIGREHGIEPSQDEIDTAAAELALGLAVAA